MCSCSTRTVLRCASVLKLDSCDTRHHRGNASVLSTREVLATFCREHTIHAPDVLHDLLQVIQVLHFDDEGAGHATFLRLDLGGGDVGAGVTDRCCDVGE